MQIAIKKMHIENFKGISNLSIQFANRTQIKGQNASGKSSIVDAFTWVLFNKNQFGDEKFQIRPLDTDGNVIHNIEILVQLVLDIDGKEVELSKKQAEKWVKKRGTETAELQGNVNTYEVDGYPKTEKDYKAYIDGLISEDLFKMITIPLYFVGMKWKEQRDILMKLCTDISDVELAKMDDQFALLVPELERAPGLDDIKSKYAKAMAEWKKQQAELPVRIDELSKSIVDIDIAELELAKKELEEKKHLYENISTKNQISSLQAKEMDLQFKMSAIMQNLNRELSDQKRQLENYMLDIKQKLNTLSTVTNSIADDSNRLQKSIEKITEEGNTLNTKYKEIQSSQFDDNKYSYDSSKEICPTCGQALPEEKIAKAKEKHALYVENLRKDFEENKKKAISEIKAKAAQLKSDINDAKEAIELKNKEIQKNKNEIISLDAELTNVYNSMNALPKEADYMSNNEYAALKQEEEKILLDIEKLKTESQDNSNIAILNQINAELDEIDKKIAQVNANAMIEERIAELTEKQQEVAQNVANQERMIYLLEQFIRFKMEKISAQINEKFKIVNFKLFDLQINGALKECCECTVNGVNFGVLNTGHRIVAGLDIISTLSNMYNSKAPIFLDNAEALNDYNIPAVNSQLILLKVSDDKELIVNETM